MRAPRLRLADIMILVALVAVDFGGVQAWFDIAGRSDGGAFWPSVWPLILGALPMGNLLAVALVVAYRRPGSRTFLAGFLAFGAAALAGYAVLATWFLGETVVPYARLLLDPLVEVLSLIEITALAIVILLAPQLAVALLGGLIVKVARRGGRTPSTPP